MADAKFDMRTTAGRAAVLRAAGAAPHLTPPTAAAPWVNHEHSDRMQIVTINMPRQWVQVLDAMGDTYTSRSEAIRVAIRDFLLREMGLAAALEEVAP